jgi:hypothetical protein
VIAGQVRLRHARLIAVVAAAVVALALLYFTRGFLFYFDEWDFILAAPAWTPGSILEPHNEHPAMLLRLIYALLLNTAGLRSYLPYMAVLLALHASSAVLLFEVVRRRAGDLVGLGAGGLFLVLGAGWENVLWAFQIGFIGSVACGLGMLLVLDGPQTRWRGPLTAGLLTASLMFSGIGLAFAVFAGVALVMTPERRKEALWLLPVLAALGAWYLAYGHNGTPPNPPPSLAFAARVPSYVGYGTGAAAAGLLGLNSDAGPYVGLFAAGVVAWDWWRKRRIQPFALGALAALISFYLVAGFTRAQLGYQQAGAGRYVYEGSVFWLLMLGDAARDLPWRGTWRPALVACVFLAAFNSSVLLFEYATAKTVQMNREQSDLLALAYERNDPCLDPNASVDPLVMPQVDRPARYYAAVDRFGAPVTPAVSRDGTVVGPRDLVTAVNNLRKCP